MPTDEELREFLKGVFQNDKTNQDYGDGPNKVGRKLPGWKRFATPSEMAQDFARKHFGETQFLWEYEEEPFQLGDKVAVLLDDGKFIQDEIVEGAHDFSGQQCVHLKKLGKYLATRVLHD